jgi:hypothetical protein
MKGIALKPVSYFTLSFSFPKLGKGIVQATYVPFLLFCDFKVTWKP